MPAQLNHDAVRSRSVDGHVHFLGRDDGFSARVGRHCLSSRSLISMRTHSAPAPSGLRASPAPQPTGRSRLRRGTRHGTIDAMTTPDDPDDRPPQGPPDAAASPPFQWTGIGALSAGHGEILTSPTSGSPRRPDPSHRTASSATTSRTPRAARTATSRRSSLTCTRPDGRPARFLSTPARTL
jgi:hypothetical protein